MAVVPDLVVLEVRQSDLVEPGDLVGDGDLQGREDRGPVQPDGVVCWVEADDVLGQAEGARGVLFAEHGGAEVGNC